MDKGRSLHAVVVTLLYFYRGRGEGWESQTSLVFSSSCRKKKRVHPPTTVTTHPPHRHSATREDRKAFIIVSAEDNNTMCSDIGTTSRVCAAYSFTGILFTVSVVRLASLPRFLLDHDCA